MENAKTSTTAGFFDGYFSHAYRHCWKFNTYLILLMIFIAQLNRCRGEVYTMYDSSYPSFTISKTTTLSCYSCMSPWYAAKIKGFDASDEVDMWKTNSMHFYHKPDKFTKHCDEDTFDAKMLKTKNCTDMCVQLSMDNAVLGRTYRTYMRGCLADLINHNRSITRYLTYRTDCTNVALKHLFNGDYRKIEQPEQKVKFCACHSHKCNGAGRSSAIELFELRLYNGLLTLGVLFVYTINKWL